MEAFADLFKVILEKYGLTMFMLVFISSFTLILVKHIIQSLENERQRTSKYINDMMEANTRITAQNTVTLNTAVNSLIKLENASGYQREEHKQMIEDNKHIKNVADDIKRMLAIK